MPLRYFILLAVFTAQQAAGQIEKVKQPQEKPPSYRLPCDCDVLRSDVRGYIPSEKEANQIVADFLKLTHQHSSINYTNTIVVKAAGCGAPESRNCLTQLPDRGSTDVALIIYNELFLKGINKKMEAITRVDRHILAHEIGHHVLGHLKNTNNEAVFSELHGTDAANKDRIARRYRVTNLQAEEIQADFFGLWLLALTEKSLDFDTFASEFNTDFIRKYIDPVSGSNSAHPLFKDRIQAMRRFWGQLQFRNAQRTGISRGYFSSTASAAYIELHPERAFWDVGFVAGLTMTGKPEFRVNGQSIDGLLFAVPNAYNLYAGLTVSRFQWSRPWRYEAEVAYVTQKYGTTNGVGSARRLIESFGLRYLTLFPKVTWSPSGNKYNRFISNRFGIFFSAGPMVRLPLGIDYQNYVVSIASTHSPSLQASVSPRVSVGFELVKKTFLPRAYKLAISYEPTQIRLMTDPQPRAISHNIDLTLLYSFARL